MKVVLCILDGWGHSDSVSYNAIANAILPCWSRLNSLCEVALLDCSGGAVGLPEGFFGNSEVGHLTIGAGRVVEQTLARVNKGIKDLGSNTLLSDCISKVKSVSGTIHLWGLLSPGGVHSHMTHIDRLLDLFSSEGVKVCLHAVLDGRDVSPRSCLEYLSDYQVSTLSGRYYAMDRDNRLERTRIAYENVMCASGDRFASAEAAVRCSYKNGLGDEFVPPAVIGSYQGFFSTDALVIANFRADRVRQMLSCFLGQQDFSINDNTGSVIGLVPYGDQFKQVGSLFIKPSVKNTLGEVVADAGLKQLRMAESEKFAHVTYFFNGCVDMVFPGEDRIIVASPKVDDYRVAPEMSAYELTNEFLDNWYNYDLVVINYANPDMVGHTGDFNATIKAVESVDSCLSALYSAVVESKEPACLLVTADHGNAELMFDPHSQVIHTSHTLNMVPFLGVASGDLPVKLGVRQASLSYIAPSVLSLLKLEVPDLMLRGKDRLLL